jgi:hypothetical protein
MHPVWPQQVRDLAAEVKERLDVGVLPNDVNVEITPRQQTEDVAANDVHLTVPAQNRTQAGSQDLVGLGSDLPALRCHLLRSIGSDYRISTCKSSTYPPLVLSNHRFVAFRCPAAGHPRRNGSARAWRWRRVLSHEQGALLLSPLQASIPFAAILVSAFIGSYAFQYG